MNISAVAYSQVPSPLIVHHPFCDNVSKSRSNECVSAIHRACNQIGYGAGLAQEVGGGVLGVACFHNDWYGDINLNELRTRHSGCNQVGAAQSPSCVAAIHRACNARGYTAGIAQELGNQVMGVACFSADWYGDIHLNELKNRHPGCNEVGKSQTPDCVAASHRSCLARGYDVGFPQEVGSNVLGVACFDVDWYGDIPIL